MSYQITIKRRAAKALGNLSNKDYQKVRDTIRELANDLVEISKEAQLDVQSP